MKPALSPNSYKGGMRPLLLELSKLLKAQESSSKPVYGLLPFCKATLWLMTGTGCVRISGLLAVAPLSHLALMNFARIVLTDRAVFNGPSDLSGFRYAGLTCCVIALAGPSQSWVGLSLNSSSSC